MALRWPCLALLAVPAVLGAQPSCPEGMSGVPVTAVGGNPVDAFCLDVTEVTVAAYRDCVGAGDCTPSPRSVAGPDVPEDHIPLWSRSCNDGKRGRKGHPINCVDFTQAQTYCAAVGKRLPTEREWQAAASGGEEARIYPWGNLAPTSRHANGCDFLCLDRLKKFAMRRRTLHYGEDGYEDTAPVGSFPAGVGRWGHHDLAGNVWEFTSSPYGDDERVRAIRGGGWAQSNPERMRTDYRGGYLTDARGSAVGFRCAANPL